VTSVTWHPNPEFLRESLQAAILVADAGARNNRVTGRSCGYGVKVSVEVRDLRPCTRA